MRVAPRVPGDLVAAHERRVAVGFVGRQLVAARVVQLEVLADALVEVRPAFTGNLALVDIQQMRHAAQDVRRRRDDSGPHRARLLEAVERARVVVEALGQELKLLSLHHWIAVPRGVQRGAQREMRRMAGHAERGFLVDARDAVVHRSPARSVGMPRITGGKDVVERGAHGRLRIRVRRRIVHARPQLVLRMARLHGHVVRAPVIQNSRRELVARKRLRLVRQRHRDPRRRNTPAARR